MDLFLVRCCHLCSVIHQSYDLNGSGPVLAAKVAVDYTHFSTAWFDYVRFGVGPKAVANSGGCWDNLGIRAARRIVPCGLRPSLSGLVSGFEQKIFLLAFKPTAKH